MYDLLLIKTCILTLCCCIYRVNSAPSQDQTKRFEIDIFLDELLKSNKFDELANKIAEKAIQKLKDLNMQEKLFDITSDKTKKLNAEPVHTDKTLNGIPGKINTNKFIKRDAMSPKEELSLKYERFIKKTTWRSSNKDSKQQKETSSKLPTFEEKANKLKNRAKLPDSEESTEEENTSESKISKDDYHKNLVNTARENNLIQKLNKRNKKDNESFNSSDELLTDKDTNISEKEKMDQIDILDKSTTIIKEVDSKSENTENKSYNLTKNIIRKENGKLFTFEKSPDYDEYHENLGKLLENGH